MKDCWTILGITKTRDEAAIKRAYRDLVKLYHPDTVSSVEKKREYTIVCAEINQAYRQAIRQAQAPESRTEPYIEFTSEETGGEDYQEPPPRAAGGVSVFRSGAMLGGFLFFFLALQLLSFFVGPISGIPHVIKTSVSFIMALFVAVFIYGIIFAGTMDLLIFWLFPRQFINRLGLEKYESGLSWLAALAANIAVFFFTDFIPAPRVGGASALDFLLRTIAAGTAPALFALNWLKELMQYKKLRGRWGEPSTD